jgi:hypothetical protein
MSPGRRRTVRVPALVPTLMLVTALTACGDDGAEESDAVETVTVEGSVTPTDPVATTEPVPTTAPPSTTSSAPTEGCDTAPPAGELAAPADDVHYTTGSGGLAIELSDGTADCVTFEATEAESGEWVDVLTVLEVGFGSTEAGLDISVSGDAEDGSDIAANEGSPFVGIQYDGFYWVDAFHTGCTVELVAFNETSMAGTFDCGEGLSNRTGGPWDDSATEVTILSATGWWEVSA